MTGMRILVATDGSPHGWRAVRLAASLPWPDGSALRAVTAAPALAAESAPGVPQERDDLTQAEAALRRPGLTADSRVLAGSAGSAIAEEAATWGADVVVVGSRGHGTVRSMLLGSVAGAVVDHVHCPVLVARGESVTSAVLADDGSDGAGAARAIVRTWPLFRTVPVRVVSVAHPFVPLATGIAPTMRAAAAESYAADLAESRERHRGFAATSAAELRAAGIAVTEELREGDPGDRIVVAAAESGADLIVVGTRGTTGIRRALLGSVARHVLLHAGCSVLIAREPGT
ncbi:MAG TPA: universal stress protein [Candidatus Limnocylindrales bacterium]|nr:universal stress protein [Candidatus Limnocylindrales bacterium]